jgi:stage II sporulation protein D
MRGLVYALLAVAAASLPARATGPEFRVELFSNRAVTALTMESAGQALEVCGAKTDGHCFALPPARKLACSAYRLLRCRLGANELSFALLTASSTEPFQFVPVIAGVKEPPRPLLVRNVQIRASGGRLQVTTQLDLEAYVAVVLRGEASVLHASAALEAMAIMARTWALRWPGRHAADGFDFCALTHCQVVRLPEQREASVSDVFAAAARATRGQVLQYQGALADPYFTACCGGMTEAAVDVWPDRGQPYLIPVRDPYCAASPHASWQQAISAEDVQQVLRGILRLPLAAPLTELLVEKRDASGRALVLRVMAGAAWNIDANQFRYAVDRRLGWQQIKSNLYTVARQGNQWVFAGHGLGHGVGLCQAGAEQMALRGASAEKILSTYFPGTGVGTQPAAEPDPIASSEHFELFYPLSQEPWVRQALAVLEQTHQHLAPHAATLPARVRVTTYSTTAEFIHSTGEPGWAAAASDGQAIALQPLELLARKNILTQTLRHELTHLVVHRLASKGVPRWFEEGVVLYLTGEIISVPPATPMGIDELERAIIRPRSEAEMKNAYAQALERVRGLARQHGEPGLWRMLQDASAKDIR